ncbi:hypothetical protein BFW87_25875 [Pseudomonas fluorescens]|uniref:Uncharacterized protein n=1 Tax=Pseudomonas fluorescens TaxID=294 RepID=A0A1T2Y289_PSEFL|nr:hypothetical protein [Pseudomonas fluorescens]OPA86179.1 hypothetical protein BFW87_25875 [Pseudomonas fluorescens]
MSITNTARQTINTPQYSGSAAAATTQDATNTVTPSSSQSAVSPVQAPTVSHLQKLLADQGNLRTLASKLRGVDTRSYGKPVNPAQVAFGLNTNTLTPQQHSSYASLRTTPQTLGTVITDLGFKLPTNVDEVAALALELELKALPHPLGNLAGALSWPVPMSNADLEKMQAFLHSDESGIKGQAGYLFRGSSFAASELRNPAQALQKMLDNPRTLALGQALQKHMQGVSSDASAYDYVLALIQHQFDPESSASPERNKIAGFDLLQPENLGLSPYQVVQKLSNHLIAKNRSGPVIANFVNYLVLARSAPQFLIKDIPDNVTIGSLAWANLSIAAATVEAERPGAVANMSFAQVMSYSKTTEGQSHADASAQRNALVDWAVANGVVEKSTDDTYNPAQLETIRKSFNQQTTERLSASQALDKAIPTRKELALEKLKERFGDLGALFEEKLLGTDQYRGEPGEVGLGGMHSLLDIAMMDLPNSRPFTSSDPRIPLEKLNNNRTFGVTKAFDEQFASTIEDKKAAVNTTVRHLISQLPLEDRKNFEYGKVRFFKEGSHKLGTGFWGTTPGPKQPQLLASIERNGETYAYEINFNDGTIKPIKTQRAKTQQHSRGAWVDKTEAFKPDGSAASLEREFPSTQSAINSFSSTRSRDIANVFVAHLELDAPEIKEQARGQTTLDKLNGGPKPLGEFLLNLIPFRSAIVNFQKGNYGDAVFDLTLDVFGFLTAGVATAGKLIKIGSAALSTSAKVLKGAKVIGVSTIGVLNPVSGLGDLAFAGGSLLGKGLGQLVSKGREVVNSLKGASGSYDLLKAASKDHGLLATGTYKYGEHAIEGGAVFRDGKWYGYDSVGKRPFGPELKSFTPNVVAFEGEVRTFTDTWLGRMIGSVLAPAAPNPNFRRDFQLAMQNAQSADRAAFIRGQNTAKPPAIYGYSAAMTQDDLKRLAVAEVRTPEELGSLVRRISELDVLPERLKMARETAQIVDLDAYQRGYNTGKPDAINGFSENLTKYQLAELAVVRGRTPEELGQLVRYIENRRINISLENYRVFSKEVTAAGGEAISLPQGFYLSQVALLSQGECAALSAAFASAVITGQEKVLMKNLFTAMVPTLGPSQIAELRKVDPAKALLEENRATKVNEFRKQLNQFQGILEKDFHHSTQSRQLTHTAIMTELTTAKSSTTRLIEAPGHGITAGVVFQSVDTIKDGQVIKTVEREWFYFDPNFGLATFPNEAAMKAGLESTLNSGRTKHLLPDFGVTPGVPEYKVSTFQNVELTNITKPVGDISDLFTTVL